MTREYQPIDQALLFSKVYRRSANELKGLERELRDGGSTEGANRILEVVTEYTALSEAFLEEWHAITKGSAPAGLSVPEKQSS